MLECNDQSDLPRSLASERFDTLYTNLEPPFARTRKILGHHPSMLRPIARPRDNAKRDVVHRVLDELCLPLPSAPDPKPWCSAIITSII